MEILSSSEMKNIDLKTIENYIPSLLLMEKAAFNTAEEIKKRFKNSFNLKILFVCGHGNNGGDGFAVARHLSDFFKESDILFLEKKEKLSEDAFINYNICKKLGINFVEKIEKDYDIIIDAIFGIGLKREIKGKYFEIIDLINKIDNFKISLDIPSGISSDNGQILGIAVKADLTISFHRAKLGNYIYPGREYSGELLVSDIGIPKKVFEKNYIKREAILKEDIKLKKRVITSHKGDAGKILVIAGNKKYTGAAYLSAEGALRSGAGLVSLAVPESINELMALKTNEVMNIALSEEDGLLGNKAYEELYKFINENSIDLILIGPGLGREEKTVKFINKVIKNIDKKFVIDADALFAIKDNLEVLKGKKAVLTPHMGEFLKLIKSDINDKLLDAEGFAKKHGIVLVLKGADTIVTNGEKTYINTSGNPGMAVGGMGDLLAGIIASFIVQGYSLEEACKISVYLHGFCGDRVKELKGELSVTPTYILEKLIEVMKEFY